MSAVRRVLAVVALSMVCACSSESGARDTADAAGPGTSATDASPAATTDPVACVSSSSVLMHNERCVAKATPPDTLDEALGKLGLDRCAFGHSLSDLQDSALDPLDPRAMDDMLPLLQTPLEMPAYGAAFAGDLDLAMASDAPIAGVIAAAAARRGASVSRTCEDGAWYGTTSNDAAPLATALADVGAPAADVSGVPRDLQVALAPVIRALAATTKDVLGARKVGAKTAQALGTVATWMLGIRHFELDDELVAEMSEVDVDAITIAAVRLALTVEHARLARFVGVQIADVDLATPFGTVVLRGPANHTYDAGSAADGAAFVLDTGGDDVYRVAVGASTVARPVSIAIDLGGRDTYAYREVRVPADAVGRRLPSDGADRAPDGRTLSSTPRQGAGVLGVGMLLDLGAGNDTYRSLVGSQGVGTHGVGVLYDEAGDDTYTAEGFSQGAAAWGIGLALDRAGNDTRTLYTSGQGFGFTRGVGALVDAAGDDAYVAIAGTWRGAPPSLAGDALYPTAQLPVGGSVVGNWSLSQGVGAGHRPDWPDPGFPMPGGIGVLRDAAGNDAYGAGVFAQGAGFVQGLGLLLDDAGDDRYDALYYAQGAAAHMGLALFDDRAGDDAYDTIAPAQAAAVGLAHDLSSAVHLDEAGNDRYDAPALSFGTAENNGAGLFVNAGGADEFAVSGSSFGGAFMGDDVDDDRYRVPTVGIFVKVGGTSTYRTDHGSRSLIGQSWGDSCGVRKWVGVDRPTGTVALR